MKAEIASKLIQAGVRAEVLGRWNEAPRAQTVLGERDVLMEGPVVDSEMDEILRAWGYETMVSPEGVRARLAELGEGPVTLRIDSPGGDVFAAANIVSVLRGREVTAVVMGMAASAAGYIAISADEVLMGSELSAVMMHRAWLVAIGNAVDLRKSAEILDKIDAAQAEKLAAATDLDVGEAMDALTNETWWTGDAAIEAGLAVGYEKDKDKPEGVIDRSPEMRRRAIAMIRGSLA